MYRSIVVSVVFALATLIILLVSSVATAQEVDPCAHQPGDDCGAIAELDILLMISHDVLRGGASQRQLQYIDAMQKRRDELATGPTKCLTSVQEAQHMLDKARRCFVDPTLEETNLIRAYEARLRELAPPTS